MDLAVSGHVIKDFTQNFTVKRVLICFPSLETVSSAQRSFIEELLFHATSEYMEGEFNES